MTLQTISTLQHFPLREAFLCLEQDCAAIHNSNAYCPCCASSKIYPLAKWIAELVEKVAK